MICSNLNLKIEVQLSVWNHHSENFQNKSFSCEFTWNENKASMSNFLMVLKVGKLEKKSACWAFLEFLQEQETRKYWRPSLLYFSIEFTFYSSNRVQSSNKISRAKKMYKAKLSWKLLLVSIEWNFPFKSCWKIQCSGRICLGLSQATYKRSF